MSTSEKPPHHHDHDSPAVSEDCGEPKSPAGGTVDPVKTEHKKGGGGNSPSIPPVKAVEPILPDDSNADDEDADD